MRVTQTESIESTLAFEAGERTDTDEDRRFSRYCDEIAKCLEVEHIDGSDDEEGYSIDAAYELFRQGTSVVGAVYVLSARMDARYKP
jgi:hypothetical protein